MLNIIPPETTYFDLNNPDVISVLNRLYEIIIKNEYFVDSSNSSGDRSWEMCEIRISQFEKPEVADLTLCKLNFYQRWMNHLIRNDIKFLFEKNIIIKLLAEDTVEQRANKAAFILMNS